jgi:hypothetical protein
MSCSDDIYSIKIIGADIIGLTTVYTLLKECLTNENLQLTIISEIFASETTSDISAGFSE